MPIRDGSLLFLGVTALSIAAFAAALRWRSWPLWLVALTLTVVSLCVAWSYR